MCKGNLTQLQCGHKLVHISERCDRKRRCSKPEGLLRLLQDSCSECHLLVSEIRTFYKEAQEEAIRAHREADEKGDEEEMARILALLNKYRIEEVEELMIARRSHRLPQEPIWPDREEHEQYVCPIKLAVPDTAELIDWSFV